MVCLPIVLISHLIVLSPICCSWHFLCCWSIDSCYFFYQFKIGLRHRPTISPPRRYCLMLGFTTLPSSSTMWSGMLHGNLGDARHPHIYLRHYGSALIRTHLSPLSVSFFPSPRPIKSLCALSIIRECMAHSTLSTRPM